MGKWSCICGQSMDDHIAPDPKCYLAYSDVIWDGIQTDNEGNVNLLDIPNPTYTVYICQNCGRLVVFGDEKCIFYKKED